MNAKDSSSLNQILSKNLNYIYQLRKSQKSELAAKLGIDSTTLENLLSRNSNVTLNTLELISSYMEISPPILPSDQYNSHELESAFLLLRMLDCFCAMSQEDRAKTAALFCELVEILSRTDAEQLHIPPSPSSQQNQATPSSQDKK